MRIVQKFWKVGLILILLSCSNRGQIQQIKPLEKEAMNTDKMTVEIWSDLICPFCYIGKRKFEHALMQFGRKEKIEVIWKSYQLNPEQKTDASQTAIQSLAEAKGISLAEAQNLTIYVTEMAKTVGLNYNFDRTPTVNTLNAHRFTHLAKTIGKQVEAEELLFDAYFQQGKNIDDLGVLQNLGEKIGLKPERVAQMYHSNEFSEFVERDIYEARQIGVQGVPFFVFNNKYGVSGAQDSDVFLKTLERSFEEFSKRK